MAIQPSDLGFGTSYKTNKKLNEWQSQVTQDLLNPELEKDYWLAFQSHPNRATALFSVEQKCKILMRANLYLEKEREAFFKHLENDENFLQEFFARNTETIREFFDYLKSHLNRTEFADAFVNECPKTITALFKN